MPAFIAERGKQNNASASSFTVPVSGVTPGNSLLLIISSAPNINAVSVSSVTDDGGGGGTWRTNRNLATTATFPGVAIVAKVITSTSFTVTVTMSDVGVTSAKAEEFSGADVYRPFDTGNTGTFAATTTPTSPSATPAVAGELAVVVFAPNGAESSFTPGTIGGVTAIQAGTTLNAGPDLAVEYVLSCAAGSQTGGGTLASSLLGASLIAFYKPFVASEVAMVEQAVGRAAFFMRKWERKGRIWLPNRRILVPRPVVVGA